MKFVNNQSALWFEAREHVVSIKDQQPDQNHRFGAEPDHRKQRISENSERKYLLPGAGDDQKELQ